MSNNKQSSVEWQFNELTKFFHIESEYKNTNDILIKVKAMHKQEMLMFVLNVMGKYRNGDVLAEVATELYEQTYGGNKWIT